MTNIKEYSEGKHIPNLIDRLDAKIYDRMQEIIHSYIYAAAHLPYAEESTIIFMLSTFEEHRKLTRTNLLRDYEEKMLSFAYVVYMESV